MSSTDLLSLPDLCLICILSHLPLNTLLELSTVCSRLNRLKRLVCLRQRKLTICAHLESLSNSECNTNVVDLMSFFDVSINENLQHCLFITTSDRMTFRKLSNLARIFPNITHFCAFRIEASLKIVTSNEMGAYVWSLVQLLSMWHFRLKTLVLCVEQYLFPQGTLSPLIDIIRERLLHLESFAIDLGSRNTGDYPQLAKLFTFKSPVLSRILIGRYIRRVDDKSELFAENDDEDENVTTQTNWAIMLGHYREKVLLNLENIQRLKNRKYILKQLTFTIVDRNSSMHNLAHICVHYSSLTYLCLRIDISNIEFIKIVQCLVPLRDLRTLTLVVKRNSSSFDMRYPSWFRNLVTSLPQLPSVESVHIYTGANRETIEIAHPNCTRTTCTQMTRFWNGPAVCYLRRAFPRAKLFISREHYNAHFRLCRFHPQCA